MDTARQLTSEDLMVVDAREAAARCGLVDSSAFIGSRVECGTGGADLRSVVGALGDVPHDGPLLDLSGFAVTARGIV